MKLINLCTSCKSAIPVVTGFCLLLTFSCKPTAAIREKESPEQLWKKANIHSYEFLLRINCYCTPETIGPHRIQVKADTIFSVNGIPYDRTKSNVILKTIPDLFLFIRESDARNPFRKSVTYDSSDGFPTSLYYDFDERIADEEIGYIITDFRKN
jgi:hypothetical protein